MTRTALLIMGLAGGLWAFPQQQPAANTAQDGSRLLSGGGRVLADIVRTTNPQQVEGTVRMVGQVLTNLPPLPRIDQNAAGNLIENGAQFLDSNSGNLQNLFTSFLANNAGSGRSSSSGSSGSSSSSGGSSSSSGSGLNLLQSLFGSG